VVWEGRSREASPIPIGTDFSLCPTGTIELVIALHEERSRFYDPANVDWFEKRRSPLRLGAQSGCVVIDATHEAVVIGVHFRPGGAPPVFRIGPDRYLVERTSQPNHVAV